MMQAQSKAQGLEASWKVTGTNLCSKAEKAGSNIYR
jgi:hypothetical protein